MIHAKKQTANTTKQTSTPGVTPPLRPWSRWLQGGPWVVRPLDQLADCLARHLLPHRWALEWEGAQKERQAAEGERREAAARAAAEAMLLEEEERQRQRRAEEEERRRKKVGGSMGGQVWWVVLTG